MTEGEQPSSEKPVEIVASPPTTITSVNTQTPTSFTPILPGVGPQSVFGLSIQHGQSTDALVAKMSDAHLTQVIAQAEQDSSRRHTENMSWMRLMTVLTIAVILATIAICYLFLRYQKGDLLEPIIHVLVGLLSGGLGGYGLGFRAGRKSQADKD